MKTDLVRLRDLLRRIKAIAGNPDFDGFEFDESEILLLRDACEDLGRLESLEH